MLSRRVTIPLLVIALMLVASIAIFGPWLRPPSTREDNWQTWVKGIEMCNGEVTCKFGPTYQKDLSAPSRSSIQYFTLSVCEKSAVENRSFVLGRFQFATSKIHWSFEENLDKILIKHSETEFQILSNPGPVTFELLKDPSRQPRWTVIRKPL